MPKPAVHLRKRLQRLELQGYKSFANRTTFEFGEAITAVVGPNGTGRSNIADAIRWALGEQSYSLLRGRKTEDMIFSGSEERSRAGMAAVTITFDNSDAWLPIDFTEVTISRRAHRDGQNEYLLNNQRIRLREISDLLAGSGLARRTYTIIGQGLVDSVLSLKAEDRRELFEEAAGIGLHRMRREEAMRRLEKTRHNLERAADILREIRPRLRGLEGQAKRAEAYGQVRQDLQAALKQWYGYHWYRRQEALRAAKEGVESETGQRNRLLQELESTAGQLLAAKQGMDELRGRELRLTEAASELREAIERVERGLAVAEARLKWIQERDAGLRAQIEEAQGELAALEGQIEAARQEAVRAAEELRSAEHEGGGLGAPPERAASRQAESRLESLSAAISGLEARRAQLQVRLQAIQEAGEEGSLLDRIETALHRGELSGLAGRLAGRIEVAPHLRMAIHAALEAFGQSLLFKRAEDLDRGLDWLEEAGAKGRYTLLSEALAGGELSAIPAPADEGCLGNALDLVAAGASERAILERLLGRTLVAADRTAARRLLAELPADARVVTLDGVIFHASGPVVRASRPGAQEQLASQGELREQLAGVERELASGLEQRSGLLAELASAQAAPDGPDVRLRLAREAVQFNDRLLSQLEQQRGRLESGLAQRRDRLAAGRVEAGELAAELADLQRRQAELQAQYQTQREQLKLLQAELSQARQLRSERETLEQRARAELRLVDAQYTQAQVELVRRQEELAGLERRIQDDFGLVAFDPEQDALVQEPLPLNGWVERLSRVQELPEGLGAQVDRLRAQLRRMGPINPDAWKEYQEVKERVEFLSSQIEDLHRAEGQLKQVIAQLDALMQREFSRTFEAVGEAFHGYFTRLFKGGSARLTLIEGGSLEETGIEIEVRLPGRREQGLAMLSGGERSLTACALIFALLKLSPTPFCVLDEVDAMLDESNVLRFGEILRELSQDTQFMVITHNRQTIQMADVVYGVSLGPDNASEVIGLKLEQVEKELAA